MKSIGPRLLQANCNSARLSRCAVKWDLWTWAMRRMSIPRAQMPSFGVRRSQVRSTKKAFRETDRFPECECLNRREGPGALVTQVGTGRCEGSASAKGPLVDSKFVGHPCAEHSGLRRMEVNVVYRGGFVPHLAGVKILDVPVFAVEHVEALQDTLPAGCPVTHIGV